MKKHLSDASFKSTRTLWALIFQATRIICAGMILTSACAAFPTDAAQKPNFILGDYDAEPRSGGHVDTDQLVQRLSDLGANTYMWLIWHSPNDWQDLAAFLPKAEKADISVWVYLAPPSETPFLNKKYPYSEPFRLDYIQWAKEIAKLSLKYPNVKGYVMDDFWGNAITGRLPADYIRKMVVAGKAINPTIKFYPLMYFTHQMDDQQFVDVWAPLLDGVVAAYPPDQAAVEHALTFLEDRYLQPSTVTFAFPAHTPSHADDHGYVTQAAQVTDPDHAQMSFAIATNVKDSTSGYHRLQLRVDNQVAWDEDISRYDWGSATVDLSKFVKNKKSVTLSLGVFDAQGVGNYAAKATFSDLTLRGLKLRDLDVSNGGAWPLETKGPFTVQRVKERFGAHKFHLPMIAMPSGTERNLKFSNVAGTPENVAKGVKAMIDMAQEGKIEGVVTYSLDKSKASASFNAVQEVFKSTIK